MRTVDAKGATYDDLVKQLPVDWDKEFAEPLSRHAAPAAGAAPQATATAGAGTATPGGPTGAPSIASSSASGSVAPGTPTAAPAPKTPSRAQEAASTPRLGKGITVSTLMGTPRARGAAASVAAAGTSTGAPAICGPTVTTGMTPTSESAPLGACTSMSSYYFCILETIRLLHLGCAFCALCDTRYATALYRW